MVGGLKLERSEGDRERGREIESAERVEGRA